MSERVEYSPYRYAKACYLCGWYTPRIATTTSLCANCGKHTVVYAMGRVVTRWTRKHWYSLPMETHTFEIIETQNIDAMAHLGLQAPAS